MIKVMVLIDEDSFMKFYMLIAKPLIIETSLQYSVLKWEIISLILPDLVPYNTK